MIVGTCSSSQYIESRIPIWILPKLNIFKDPVTDEVFPVYQCTTCYCMKAVLISWLVYLIFIFPSFKIPCGFSIKSSQLLDQVVEELNFAKIENAEDSHKILHHQDDDHMELLNDDMDLRAIL